jgi:hypothetical protein
MLTGANRLEGRGRHVDDGTDRRGDRRRENQREDQRNNRRAGQGRR